MPSIGNIKVKGVKKGFPRLDDGEFILNFYKTNKDLSNPERFNQFVKAVEKLVRGNKRYNMYKAYLIEEKGLDYCQVHPNVKVEDAPIEMHHGPLITLYDMAAIITKALLARDYPYITTMMVARLVLEEHFNHHVQVTMLCEDCHDIFHAGGYIYINPKQGFGNLKQFLENWSDGIDKEMRNSINEHLKLAQQYQSTDNGILTANSGKSWKK